MNSTTVVNLFGGSGIGKSTTAAHLYAEMKYAGFNVELVREYVKAWAWHGKQITPFDQTYILGKQSQYESSLYGKVDYIVTDSPLLLGPVYETFHTGSSLNVGSAFAFLDQAKKNGVEHRNFVLKRNEPFDTRGRYESLEQATQVDNLIEHFLNLHHVHYDIIDAFSHQRAHVILSALRCGEMNSSN